MQAIAVVGRGPGCGKTLVAMTLLRPLGARKLPAVGLKIIDCGCGYTEKHDLESDDGNALRAASSVEIPPLVASPYRLAPDLPPVEALAESGLELSHEDLLSAVQEAARFGTPVIDLTGGRDTELVPGTTTLALAEALGGPIVYVSDGPDDTPPKGAVMVNLNCENPASPIPGFTAEDDAEVELFRHLEPYVRQLTGAGESHE